MSIEEPNTMTKKTKETPKPEGSDVPQSFAEATQESVKVESVAATSTSKELDALKEALEAAKTEAQANWDKLLRKEAELQNVQRRAQQDLDKARKFANDRLAEDLLPVIDSFEQALTHQAEAKGEPVTVMMEGIELTRKMLMDILAKYGIQEVNPVNAAFDPQLHEAISMHETDDVKPNQVIAVVQKGYLIHDRVLRAARVVLSRAPASK